MLRFWRSPVLCKAQVYLKWLNKLILDIRTHTKCTNWEYIHLFPINCYYSKFISTLIYIYKCNNDSCIIISVDRFVIF